MMCDREKVGHQNLQYEPTTREQQVTKSALFRITFCSHVIDMMRKSMIPAAIVCDSEEMI